MKVFAKYFDENGVGYRTNTILQFGTSTKIIGAAFLINPGSAKPIRATDGEQSKTLASISKTDDENWFEFTSDSTMNWLSNIFNGKYIGKTKKLEGIILLFNLFNLRDPNCYQAVMSAAKSTSSNLFTTEHDLSIIKDIHQVYLGWGGEGYGNFRDQAKYIFDNLSEEQKYYLDKEYNKNKFCHPRGVQLWHKKSKYYKDLLSRFFIE